MNTIKPLLIASLLAAGGPSRPAPAAPPNIVLFVTDDQGQDAGCYGNPVVKTPNLDALAAEGTRYTHAFTTTASCSPSRSVILSGRYGHANGMYGLEHAEHHFRSQETLQTLPLRLARAGYRTARVGKYHVGPEPTYHFDTALPGNARNGVAMADSCRDFVGQHVAAPFFLYFCTADPHRGGKGRAGGPLAPDLFGNDKKHPGITEVTFDPKDVVVPPWLPDTPASRAEIAQYYQSIARADQGLGRLVQLLKDAGQWENTLLLYISDHGAPFQGSKTTTYEPGLKIPCVLRLPRSEGKGAVSSAMVSLVDVAPTLLDAAGALPTDGSLQGRSFLSTAGRERADGWDEIYASHTMHEVTMYYPMRVVRTRTHKLIWNVAHELPFPSAQDLWQGAAWQEAHRAGPDAPYGRRTVRSYLHRPEFELYDLAADPDEAKNLADDPAQAARLAELKEKLRAFQKRTQDPWILKWERE
jgi:N-sulfoglucosamine sulfohydrolase